jgi:uncharacterized protein Yka (UPF0111/DUF47 family)
MPNDQDRDEDLLWLIEKSKASGVDIKTVIQYLQEKLVEDRALNKAVKEITDIESYCNRTTQLVQTEIFLLLLKKHNNDF